MKNRDHEGLWRKRLSAWERSGQSVASIELVELGHGERRRSFELVTAAGIVVRLPSDFDTATLKRLLDVLDDRG